MKKTTSSAQILFLQQIMQDDTYSAKWNNSFTLSSLPQLFKFFEGFSKFLCISTATHPRVERIIIPLYNFPLESCAHHCYPVAETFAFPSS